VSKKIDEKELERLQKCAVNLGQVDGAYFGMSSKRPVKKEGDRLILSARLNIKKKENEHEHS